MCNLTREIKCVNLDENVGNLTMGLAALGTGTPHKFSIGLRSGRPAGQGMVVVAHRCRKSITVRVQ